MQGSVAWLQASRLVDSRGAAPILAWHCRPFVLWCLASCEQAVP